MWQRLFSRKISRNFAVLGKVMRNRGRITVDVPSGGFRWDVIICLTLMTSKPRLTNPSDILSWSVKGQVTDYGFYRFFRFQEKV
jgi:hypothetical protein